jgi:heat shock protein HslJ
LIAIVVMALAAAACAGDGAPSDDGAPSSIEGTTWILGAASAEALVDEDLPPDVRATARFETDGTVGGTTGCNTFGGSHTFGDGGALTIEPGAMTEIACEEPLMRLEAAYTAALSEVESFEIVDGGEGLVLSGADTLAFTPERSVGLEGTRWQVSGIVTGDAVSSTIAGAEAELTLDVGSLSGTTGCNRMTGSYSIESAASERSVSFSDIGTTKMLCEPDVSEQERQIIASLEGATSYSIEGSTMSLSDADGSLLLTLVAA